MGLTVIPPGAEIRIRKELLEGASVQEVANKINTMNVLKWDVIC